MSKTSSILERVEKKWLKLLYNYCKEQFFSVHLPSHDHTHHLRVWGYAKEIFKELETSGFRVNTKNIEKAMIAIFFHDVGLTKTIDEVGHGLQSRKMCEEFFKKNKLTPPKDFQEVVDAIKYHDDKEYKSKVYSNNLPKDNVMSVLFVADDLDAFGIIGVLRYSEIYLLRDKNIMNLPKKVLANLESRYNNFYNVYGNLESFASKQKQRYLQTKNFYENLEKELMET